MKSHQHGVFLFRTQLSLILLPVILFPLAFIGYISYQISYSALQKRSAANVSQIAELVNQNLDTTLQQAIQLAKMPLYDTTIQQIVTYYAQHPDLNFDRASLQDIQYVGNFSLNILIHNTNIDSVDIYTAGSTAFPESSIGLQPFENWTALPWFQELMRSSSVRTLLLPTHVEPSAQGNLLVFSVVQAIVNVDTFQTVGAIVLNIDAQNAIEQVITDSASQSDTTFLIYGANGQTMYVTPFKSNASNTLPGEQVRTWIHDHLRQDLTLFDLSLQFHYSVNYLSMLFKREMGTGFQEYLLACRMQRAKHLLLDATLRISDIAQQVGYTNPKAFSMAFHKTCGIPPTEYREMRGRETNSYDAAPN